MAKPTETNLFQRGEFVLNSGARSGWKLECDALTDDDWEALAYMIWQVVGQFKTVEGVPRGGLKLADRLDQYRCRDPRYPDQVVSGWDRLPHLIVDDVLTTGGSMMRLWQKHRDALPPGTMIEPGNWVIGAVVFARGLPPPWVTPLFQMPRALWLPKAPGPDAG